MFACFTINYHSCIIIGKRRNYSVPTEVAIAAVTVAVMAVVVMLVKTSKTTIVATIVVGLLLVLGAWWSSCNTGTFRSHLQDLGIALSNKT